MNDRALHAHQALDLLGVCRNLFLGLALEQFGKFDSGFTRNPCRQRSSQTHVVESGCVKIGFNGRFLVRQSRELSLILGRYFLTNLLLGFLSANAVLGSLVIRLLQLLPSPLRKLVLNLRLRRHLRLSGSLSRGLSNRSGFLDGNLRGNSFVGHKRLQGIIEEPPTRSGTCYAAAAMSLGSTSPDSMARRSALSASLPR